MKRSLLFFCIWYLFFTGCSMQNTSLQKKEISQEAAVYQNENKEKQEITPAFWYEDSQMQAVVDAFNAQSPDYQVNYVTYMQPGEMAIGKREELEKELKQGKGPDILQDFMVDLEEYVKKGYLQPLDGVVQEELFLQAAMEAGKYKGITYGIPYGFTPIILMAAEELTGEKETWTLQEMMEVVKNSGAEVFMCGCDGEEIIKYCAIAGAGEEVFLNWEKNTCNFDNSEFCEFLEFAKEYADIHMADPNNGSAIQKGKIATMCRRVLSLLEMNYYDEVFENQTNYIGFPCKQGQAVYAEAQCLYMNAASTKKEGVNAFLNFLLSEEIQKEKVDRLIASFTAGGAFCVRLSTLDYYIESQKANHKGDRTWEQGSDGINFYYSAMTDKQEQQFREILTHCIPVDERRRKINSIVGDVTDAFFEGGQSAEYTAKELQRKVQEYLDNY